MSTRERFKTDPLFATLVTSFRQMFEQYCGSGAGITPTEIREASGLAWQIYAETHPAPIPFLPRLEQDPRWENE